MELATGKSLPNPQTNITGAISQNVSAFTEGKEFLNQSVRLGLPTKGMTPDLCTTLCCNNKLLFSHQVIFTNLKQS